MLNRLSFGRSLILLGAVGATGTLLGVAGLTIAAQQAAEAHERLATNASARSLARALATRASELKVDGYKSLLMAAPADEVGELADDVGKVPALLDELDALPLTDAERQAVEPLRASFADYQVKIRAVVDGAIRDQAQARTSFEDIQTANDATDDAVGAAVDALDALAVTETEEARAVAARTGTVLTALGLLAVLLVVVLAVVLRRRLVSRLDDVAGTLATAAQGDLTARVSVEQDDELSRMGRAANAALDSIATLVSHVAQTGQRLAGEATTLQQVAERAASSATDAADQAGRATGVADSVSANVDDVARGAHEMGASIAEIAGNAQRAVAVAEGASRSVRSSTSRMNELAESSRQIGDVVRLITSIAEQTNLLALNATIEAARAGAAGKGFAVVADEVKQLAQQTARATGEIAERVDAIQADTTQAVEAIAGIAEVMDRITEFQSGIAGAVEEQNVTTSGINESVGLAAGATADVAATVRQVSESAALTAEVVGAARGSSELLNQLGAELTSATGRYRF